MLTFPITTVMYQSPEMLTFPHVEYDSKSDIWALGCVLMDCLLQKSCSVCPVDSTCSPKPPSLNRNGVSKISQKHAAQMHAIAQFLQQPDTVLLQKIKLGSSSSSSLNSYPHVQTLPITCVPSPIPPPPPSPSSQIADSADLIWWISFLRTMLHLAPAKRPSAADLLLSLDNFKKTFTTTTTTHALNTPSATPVSSWQDMCDTFTRQVTLGTGIESVQHAILPGWFQDCHNDIHDKYWRGALHMDKDKSLNVIQHMYRLTWGTIQRSVVILDTESLPRNQDSMMLHITSKQKDLVLCGCAAVFWKYQLDDDCLRTLHTYSGFDWKEVLQSESLVLESFPLHMLPILCQYYLNVQ